MAPKAHGWELEAALQRPLGGFSAVGQLRRLVDTRVVTNLRAPASNSSPGSRCCGARSTPARSRVAYMREPP